MSTPLKTKAPRTFPTYQGQVFRRQIDDQTATYLYCDKERRHGLEEYYYCFIVFSSGMHFRSKFTEGEIKAYGLEERRGGLSAVEMNMLSYTAYRKWEEAEYRAMGVTL